MKKLLFTTVLVSSLISGTAYASENPKIKIEGFSKFQAGVIDEDLIGADKDVVFRNDNEFKFTLSGKSPTGINYGAVLEIEADLNDSTTADRTHIYMSRDVWGRLEFGSIDAATDTMKIDAATIARATGGIDGDFRKYLVDSTGAGTPGIASTIIRPASPMGSYYTGDGYEESTKINYYTPGYQGIKFGFSYTPEVNNEGQIVTGDYIENVFSLAFEYTREFEEVDLAFTVNTDMGDAVAGSGVEDIDAWQAGIKLGFKGIEFAGSYGDWNESLMLAGSGVENSYYTLGLAYSQEKWGVSATYFTSEEEGVLDTEFTNIVIGGDYTIIPGMTVCAEASIIDDEKSDNDGTVFILGTALNF